MENIIKKSIEFCILLLTILLPTSSLSLYFNIHPAVIIIFLLLVLAIIANYKSFNLKKFNFKKIYEENKELIPLFLLFFLLFLQSIFSLVFAPKLPNSAYSFGITGFESPDFIRWYGVFTLFKSLIFGFLIAILVKEKEFFLKIIKTHILASVVFSLFGIINFLTCYIFQISSFDFGVTVGRVKSVSVEPQAFASYLLTVIPFLLLGLLSAPNNKNLTFGFKKKFLALFLIIDFSALALTFSLGGFIAFLAMVFLFFVSLCFKKYREQFSALGIKIFSACFLIFIISAFFFGQGQINSMLQKFNIQEPSSLGERLASWQAGIEMIKSYPLFGVGPESYGYFFKEYSNVSLQPPTIAGPGAPAVILPLPQNLLIGMAANIGILGAIFVFLIFLYLGVKLWQRYNIVTFSLFLVLLCLFVQNIAFWTPYAFFLWFFIGLGGALIKYSYGKTKTFNSPWLGIE